MSTESTARYAADVRTVATAKHRKAIARIAVAVSGCARVNKGDAMTFSELNLVIAIKRLNCGSRDYNSQRERLIFAIRVQSEYCRIRGETVFPFTVDDVHAAYLKLRKNADTKLKAEIADTHGVRCFWIGRGKGDCDEDAEAGHIVPRCKGGPLTVANAMIECRKHNNARREKSIEEYLSEDESP